MGPGCHSLTDLCADLTDVTLADEDNNSIPTETANGNRAVPDRVAICKWRHLVAKIVTDAFSYSLNLPQWCKNMYLIYKRK